MEYILLQPLQTNNPSLNVSLVERKYELTTDEKKLILHEASGAYSGFVVKKILPLHLQTQSMRDKKCDLTFKLNVYMKNTSRSEMQHEVRTIQFWFATNSEKERMTYSNSFFHNLFKGDNFPKDYFMFLLRIMQIFKALKAIQQLKIEIEQTGQTQPPSSPSKYSFLFSIHIFVFIFARLFVYL
jgi:hypothetical protein